MLTYKWEPPGHIAELTRRRLFFPLSFHLCPFSLRSAPAVSQFLWRPRKKTGTFRCDVCAKPFSNKANMQRHKVLHATVRDVYFCDICSRPFSWKSSLERHKRDMHALPASASTRDDPTHSLGGVFPDVR